MERLAPNPAQRYFADAAEGVVSFVMRYHKAVLITRPEAEYIIRSPAVSLNTCAVVESFDVWYDVRRMTEAELADFVASLHRDHLSAVASGRLTPH